NDDFAEDTDEFYTRDHQYDDDGNRMARNLDSNGRFHTDWLNMIYPRLWLARDLLSDKGIILINIDENEITNLQKICNEVFGEVNDLGTIVWDKRNPKGEVQGIAYQHEYILVFAKNKVTFSEKCKMQRPKKNAVVILDKAEQFFKKINLAYPFERANKDFAKWVSSQNDFTGGEKAYNSFDENGKVYRPVSMAAPDKPETRSHRPLIHPVTNKPCPIPVKGWRFPNKSMDILLQNGEILFGADETTQPRRKYLLEENMYDNIPSLLHYGGSDTRLLANLGIPFDTPKVVEIVMEHVQAFTTDGDIILDFFSGSATTAHAVIQLNAADEGHRKFIMVQLPEICAEDTEAAKAGYKNICEIGKERIRRAGAKIKSDSPLTTQDFDTGFRVLKLDSTNMRDVYYTPREYTQRDLDGLIDNIKPDRTPEDLLFQVMLDLGVPLSAKIRRGGGVFYVNDNYLIACFEKADDALVTTIAQAKPYYAVFRDSDFASDSALVNFEQIFATYSPTTVRRVL
ncbi:MAG: site-specific DNA-methyltransferase, partial [Synergistaceae bacterium]|nr:site-specific DNA-methyltransferase [Synergistaceae bacterium]